MLRGMLDHAADEAFAQAAAAPSRLGEDAPENALVTFLDGVDREESRNANEVVAGKRAKDDALSRACDAGLEVFQGKGRLLLVARSECFRRYGEGRQAR
jgi:hypothetical protein